MKIRIIILTLMISAQAQAQYYPNPCAAYRPPQPGLIGAIVNPMIAQQQAQACAQAQHDAELRRQYDTAQAQYRAQAQQAAAAAKQRQVEQQQAVEQATAAARAKKQAEQREHARQVEVAAQLAAESSPDNYCHEPKLAKVMIEEFNRFKPMKTMDEQVVDIEHVTTRKFDAGQSDVICHGTFVTTNGRNLVGTFEMKKNIAGDPIVLWKRD